MGTKEFSDTFDTFVSSYRRFRDFDKQEATDTIEFDEYEKSVYLTTSQDELVKDLYSGRNPFSGSFENTEEIRRYLDPLVKEESPSKAASQTNKLTEDSVLYTLPSDVNYIVYEQIIPDDEELGCANETVVPVQPMTHDEFHKLRKNPFRGITAKRAIRLDAGKGVVEIIYPYDIDSYKIRYIAVPSPIIVDTFSTDVKIHDKNAPVSTPLWLPDVLHETIVERAVRMALASKGIRLNN